MRLFGILLLCCFTFGAVSAFSFGNIQWPSWITSLFSSTIDKLTNKVCLYLAEHPDRAALTIQKVNETLQETSSIRETFVMTINYLNSEENRQKLVNGTSSCTMFFKEIRDAIQADLNNKGSNMQSAKDKASSIIKDILSQLKDAWK